MIVEQLKYTQSNIAGMSRSNSSRVRDDRGSSSSKNNRRSDNRYDKDYDRDYDRKRRGRNSERDYLYEDRQERNRYTNRSHDSDRHRRRSSKDDDRDRDRKSNRTHRSRSRSKSYTNDMKSHRRHSSREKTHRSYPSSRSYDDRIPKDGSISRDRTSKPIRIVRASQSRSKSPSTKYDDNSGHHDKDDLFEIFKNERQRNGGNATTIIFDGADSDDFDKEKIHREMQERLTQHLAREGKVYPPPKPQASHPIFANDGSFLETFKKLQEQQQQQHHHFDDRKTVLIAKSTIPSSSSGSSFNPNAPVVGKRRGGKILKTGIVQKPRVQDEGETDVNQTDAWAMYLQEVKKYKNISCDADSKTRPLVK